MPQPRHATPPASPFAVLGLTPDADLDAVRRAFRSAALSTHPDRGGDPAAFRSARAAYDALRTPAGLARERARWAPPPPPPPPPRRPARPGVLFSVETPGVPNVDRFTLDGDQFPPAPAHLDAAGKTVFDLDARPPGWTPGTVGPPNGGCLLAVHGDDREPLFGVWAALDGFVLRLVFGPHPANVAGGKPGRV